MEKLSISSPLSPSSSSFTFTLNQKVTKGVASLHALFVTSTLSMRSLTINEENFIKVSKQCNLIPLYRCIFTDQLTPVMAYRCLVKEEDRESPSFLFDSFGQGFQDSNVGRYSVLGHQPVIEITAKENRVTIVDHEEGRKTEEFVDDPLRVPQRIMQGWIPLHIDELPNFFCGM